MTRPPHSPETPELRDWLCPTCRLVRRAETMQCEGDGDYSGVDPHGLPSHALVESPWLQLRRAKEDGDTTYQEFLELLAERDELQARLVTAQTKLLETQRALAAAQRDSDLLSWLIEHPWDGEVLVRQPFVEPGRAFRIKVTRDGIRMAKELYDASYEAAMLPDSRLTASRGEQPMQSHSSTGDPGNG